jgi:polar amino acid transport system permease protein
MFLTYFGLPTLGFSVSPLFAAGAVADDLCRRLSRRDLARLHRVRSEAQWEAAEGLALSRRSQRMIKVILPQAVRIATPPTVGFMVQIIKNTSLASVVGFVELARAGQIINNSLFEPFLIYTIIAVIYFASASRSRAFSQRLERRGPRMRASVKSATQS